MAGVLVAVPCATWPKLQPCNTSTQGDEYRLYLSSSQVGGRAVMPSGSWEDAAIANAAAADPGMLRAHLYLLDATGNSAMVDRALQRVP